MGELIMMVLLLRIMKSQGKGKVRVFWRKKRRRRRNVPKEEAWKLLFIHRRVGILIKFPKYPYVFLQNITFFPLYKKSSSNFTNKRKRDNKINEKGKGRSFSSLPLPPKYSPRLKDYSTILSPSGYS